MNTIVVCVGSSCHIKGARKLLEQFNALIKENKLEEQIELKGSFCMERCGEGVNWQIDDELYTSSDVEDAVEIFRKKIINPLKNSNT